MGSDIGKSRAERNRPISAISAAGDVLRVHARSQIVRTRADFAQFSEMSDSRDTDWRSKVDLNFQPRLSSARRQPNVAPCDFVTGLVSSQPKSLGSGEQKTRLPPEHRKRLQQLFVLAQLPIDARGENPLHRWRQPQLRERARHPDDAVAHQRTHVEQRLHHLLDEERIAAGALRDQPLERIEVRTIADVRRSPRSTAGSPSGSTPPI
jgi:hypothetical protein